MLESFLIAQRVPDGTEGAGPAKSIHYERDEAAGCKLQQRTMGETLDFLSGKIYLSKADVVSAFHTIPIADEDCHKTAFVGLHGQKYHYVRGCFGLRDLPFTFQMAIDMALSGISDAIAYFDDLVFGSNSLEKHLETLRDAFTRLRAAGLFVRIDKCEFLPESMELLGFVIEKGKIRPSEEKIKAVANFPRPTDRKSVRSFLGLASFLRRHIKNFAAYARPLNRLTSVKVPFIWTKTEETAFLTLKEKLTKEPVILHLPDLSAPFQVVVDTSGYCSGAILKQRVGDEDRVIAYASKQLKSGELKRSATEREMSGVLWALQMWRLYLLGASGTTVLTDHKPLLNLKVTQDHSALLTRMLAKTIPYNITLQYLPGDKMPSDCLSRIPESEQSKALVDPETLAAAPRNVTRTVVPDGSLPTMEMLKTPPTPTRLAKKGRRNAKALPVRPQVRSILPPTIVNRDMVQAAQAEDTECQNIMSNIKLYPELATVNGVLVSRQKPKRQKHARKNRPYVPIALRSSVVRQFHQVGHLSIRKTLAAVEAKYEFPFMHRTIEVLPYSPQANSVEASHKTLGNILSKLVADNKRTWHTKLPRVMMSMNGTPHESHGHQPHQVLTGHEFRYPFPDVVGDKPREVAPRTYVEALKSKVQQIHRDVRRELQASSRARIEAKNKNRLWREFQTQDLVLYRDPRLPTGKLAHERWRGPLVVTHRHTKNAYRIQEMEPPYSSYDVPLRSIKQYHRPTPLPTDRPVKPIVRKGNEPRQSRDRVSDGDADMTVVGQVHQSRVCVVGAGRQPAAAGPKDAAGPRRGGRGGDPPRRAEDAAGPVREDEDNKDPPSQPAEDTKGPELEDEVSKDPPRRPSADQPEDSTSPECKQQDSNDDDHRQPPTADLTDSVETGPTPEDDGSSKGPPCESPCESEDAGDDCGSGEGKDTDSPNLAAQDAAQDSEQLLGRVLAVR
ncbi:hypothetical protein FOCC_FOCC012622 [Frankliniella occidentalis]|nr:hypothetical protein FOCC_FOCC012622 [Frankliniella occidentalis]